jgi:hypothetical protein
MKGSRVLPRYLMSTLLVTILFAQDASATVLDFEDVGFGVIYGVSDSFTTSGVVITGQEFFWLPSGSTTDGFAYAGHDGWAGGAGKELCTNNINLSFDFDTILDGLALQYGEFGGNINLEINGSLANVEDFANIPANLGGTSVFTLDTGTPGQSKGAMFVTGTINSFKIGGQELWIDNVVASPIPEPATLVLLGTAGLWIFTRKKTGFKKPLE